MNKAKLFYSELCPDTKPFVAELERMNIDYQMVNIFEAMTNFKQFLRLRDTNKAFDNVKTQGYAGIPVLVIDDERVILDLDELKNIIK